MPKIDPQAVMAQFDLLTKTVFDHAGRSADPAEVDQVARGFEASGNGEAAFAVRKSHQLAQLAELKQDGISRGDFQAARSLVEGAINRVNKGFVTLGPRELGGLQPVLRPIVSALVEMARMDAVGEAVYKQPTFDKGFDDIAAHMKRAAGEDRCLTPDEAADLASKLRQAGHHTAAHAVQNLAFIASRRSGADAVTNESLDATIAWAKSAVAKKLDAGDTDNLAKTWQAVFRHGLALENGITDAFVPNKALSAHDKFRGSSNEDQSWHLFGSSYNDIGGVAQSGAPQHVADQMADAVREAANFMMADGYIIEDFSPYTHKVEDETGAEKVVGYSMWVDAAKGDDKLSVEYFFDNAGRDRGFMRFEPKAGFFPSVPSGDSSDFPPPGDWEVQTRLTDTELQTQFAANPNDLRLAAAQLARQYLSDKVLPYRRDDSTGVIEAQGEYNTWELGEAYTADGDFLIVRWNDLDDSSYTMWFDLEPKKADATEAGPAATRVNYDN